MKWIFNLIIMIIFVALVVFSIQWLNHNESLPEEENPTPYIEYITERTQDSWKFFMEKAYSNDNNDENEEINVISDLSSALKEIKMDRGDYPDDIKVMVEDYIKENSLNISSDMFFYEKTESGFEVGIRLDNGEEYKINVP